jgi:hypothetical protein
VRLLIRYTQARDKTLHEFDGSVVTIGRATDQTIQIADNSLPLSHSKLSGSGEELILTASGGQSFVVNGQIAKKQSLVDGDVVEISGHKLKILAGENDFPHLIEVELDSDQITELKNRFATGLKEINAPQRRFTWVLFLLLLGIGLLIPVIGLLVGIDKAREIPLVPDDSVWLTGELHQTHAFMGDDCTFCHTEPFVQTRDEDCLFCHLSVNHHFNTEKFGNDYKTGDSCGDCHNEHSVTEGITRTDQHSCTICHADLRESGFETDRLRSATDFLDDHPTFKLSMLRHDGGNDWHEERIDLWAEDLTEESNLKFPHDVHLDKAGIRGIEGTTVMECSDCHESDKGGYKMKTVTMEQHCSDCHALTFDPDTPNRVVPHGSPPDLMRTLREYYAYEFLNPGNAIKASGAQEAAKLELIETRSLRRPGKLRDRKSITELKLAPSIDQSASMTERAQSYIEARVNDAASNLFEKQTCTICHEVTKTGDSNVPWHVKPVRLSESWMPLSIFKHEGHKNMQCNACHDAEVSESATDVLMPNLASCRNCHGGEDSSGLLQSTCVTCHDFHMTEQGPMGELMDIINPNIGITKMETATLNLRNADLGETTPDGKEADESQNDKSVEDQ